MGKLQQQLGHLNDGDALRALLHECERQLAALGATNTNANAIAKDLLCNTNDAHHLLDKLTTAGADMRPEASRLETIDERIVKSARAIVHAVGGATQFAALRQQQSPTSQAQRWHLDDAVTEARRRLVRQILLGVSALAVLLFATWLARPILFPPDPIGDAIRTAQTALEKQEPHNAIRAIELGLSQHPTNTQLLLWKGVLLNKTDAAYAQTVFDRARAGVSARDFYLERAQIHLALGQLQSTVDDANALLAIDTNSAEAYYMRGSAYELLGQKAQAIDDIGKCAELAEAQGNATLVATARVRLGMLLQAP